MEIIRAKWTMDGSTTLGEAAVKLRAFADELDRMEADGWQLERPVEDDYGYATKPGETDDDDIDAEDADASWDETGSDVLREVPGAR
jgi:hypothetical protein